MFHLVSLAAWQTRFPCYIFLHDAWFLSERIMKKTNGGWQIDVLAVVVVLFINHSTNWRCLATRPKRPGQLLSLPSTEKRWSSAKSWNSGWAIRSATKLYKHKFRLMLTKLPPHALLLMKVFIPWAFFDKTKQNHLSVHGLLNFTGDLSNLSGRAESPNWPFWGHLVWHILVWHIQTPPPRRPKGGVGSFLQEALALFIWFLEF